MSDAFYDPSFAGNGEEISFLRADRQPCPVCGHPTGDCSADDDQFRMAFGSDKEKLKSLSDSQKILVPEDMYEERHLSSFATIKVRIARKGSYVTIDKARELGILKD